MTANVISQVLHSAVNGAPIPKVGDGVTVIHWTDRTVGTITKVINPRMIEFTEDTTTSRVQSCEAGHQEWIHTPNPNGPGVTAIQHEDGRWYIAKLGRHGRYTVSKKSTPVAVGRRDYHYDWSF